MIVAVTGAFGYLGTRLIQKLTELSEVDRIIAIDKNLPKQLPGPKIHFHRHDISLPLGDLLTRHNVDSVVHMAYQIHHGRDDSKAYKINVGGSQNLVNACDSSVVKKLVYLSSTTVYGAHPDNQYNISESDLTRPIKGHIYAEHKVQSENIFQDFSKKHHAVTLTILRSCPVLGPNADNFISKSLSKKILVGITGYNPRMQLIHEDDITTSISKCLLSDHQGVYNLAGRDSITWNQMASILGRWKISIPAAILYPLTELTWKLRIQSRSPSSGLNLIRYPWIVNTEKARRDLGMKFGYSTLESAQIFAASQKH